MIAYKDSREVRLLIANCNCGCDEEIHITKIKNEQEYYLSLLTSRFYSEQDSLFKIFCKRLKLAFKILFGKQYLLTSLVLNEEDIDDLIQNLKNLKENE